MVKRNNYIFQTFQIKPFLKKSTLELNKKIFDINEVIESLTYKKDERGFEAIFLNKELGNFNYELSKILFEQAAYLKNDEDSKPNILNDKIELLKKTKAYCLQKHKINKSSEEISFYSNSKIINFSKYYLSNFENHSYENNFSLQFKNLLKDNNIKIIEDLKKDNLKYKTNYTVFENPKAGLGNVITKYENNQEEAYSVLNQICYLLNEKKVNYKDILIITKKENVHTFRLMSNSFHGLNLDIENISLKTVNFFKNFLDNLRKSISDADSFLEKNNKIKTSNYEFINTIEIIKQNYDEAKKLFIENSINQGENEKKEEFVYFYLKDKLSNICIPSKFNGIKVLTNLDENVYKYKYVFVTYFDKSYQANFSNSDFLSDSLNVKYTYLDTSYEKNILLKEKNLYLLSSIENLYLSYPSYDISNGETDINELVIKNVEKQNSWEIFLPVDFCDNFNSHYSKDIDSFFFNLKLQNYETYGIKSNDFNHLLSFLTLSDYQKNFINNKVKFDLNKCLKFEGDKYIQKRYEISSYSDLNIYSNCPFKFFMEKILKISEYDDKSIINILGDISHKVLEEFIKSGENVSNFIKALPVFETFFDVNFAKNGKKFLKLNQYSKKDSFYLKQVYDLKNIYLNKFYKFYCEGKFKQTFSEQPVKMKIANSIINGKIDCMVNKNDSFVIVDFKTGNKDIDIDKLYNGIDSQLGFYALTEKNESHRPSALFYMQTLSLDSIFIKSKDNNAQNFKGRILDISLLDSDLDSDEIKIFHKNFKISRTIVDFNKIFKNMENQLSSFVVGIENGIFDVKSKQILKKDDFNESYNSCTKCPFKDCCYINENDKSQIEILERYK